MAIGLTKLPGVIFKRWREPSTCEACGGEFLCGATLAGCWCSEIKLTEEQRAKLKEQYRSCLCGECLRTISSDAGTVQNAKVASTTNDE